MSEGARLIFNAIAQRGRIEVEDSGGAFGPADAPSRGLEDIGDVPSLQCFEAGKFGSSIGRRPAVRIQHVLVQRQRLGQVLIRL